MTRLFVSLQILALGALGLVVMLQLFEVVTGFSVLSLVAAQPALWLLLAGGVWLVMSTSSGKAASHGPGAAGSRPLPRAWCEGCEDERKILNGRIFHLPSNGKTAIRGECEQCHRTLTGIPPTRRQVHARPTAGERDGLPPIRLQS